MCAYPPSEHAFPHFKFVLRCCYICPHIDLPGQEPDRRNSKTSPSKHFHINNLIARFKVHRRHPLDEKKFLVCV